MIDSPGPPPAAFLGRLMDHVPAMLAYWDRDLLCRFANRAYERWFGVKPEALFGRPIQELLGPALFALNEPHIRAALRGEPQQFERIVPGPDGVQRHSLAHYLPDIVDGEVAGFVAYVTEITRLKQTEAALRESQRWFQSLTEASPFAVFRSDASGRCAYLSARWREISGRDPVESLGLGWLQALRPEDRDAALAAWRTAAAAGRELDIESRLLHADGELRYAHLRARPVAADSGPASDYVGAIEDITERKRAAQRLRASESFLDRAGRIAGVGGWEVDLRTKILTWSDRTRQIHEVGRDYRPTYTGAIEFYPPEVRPQIEAAVTAAIERGEPWDMELPFVTATGRRIWVRTFGEADYEGGVPVRLVGAFQDITAQRLRRAELQREQTLRAELERHAKELDRLLHERSEMLDVLAHEVRQPLNNASAALQSAATALADVGEQVASQRLTRAQAVMGQVLASIDNTLAVASLLARPDPIHRADTDIDMLLAVAIADMPADERSRVRVERATGTRTASMDMSLMRLALRNLLANALAYSPPGLPVTLRVSDSDQPLALLIDVIDAGPGIPAERLPRLFERGVSTVPAGEAPIRSQGLGLGLYIVRRVMELHGGHVQLVANTPRGATMRLIVAQAPDD